MTVNIITPPTAEPVTLAELKLFAKIDTDADDALVTSLGIAAREFVEVATGLALMEQTLEAIFPAFPPCQLKIPRPPLQSIVSVSYLDRDGATQTLTADIDYTLDKDSAPAIIAPVSDWPRTIERSNAVKVRYVAGYADADAVPQRLKFVICALAAWWHEHPEPGVIGQTAGTVPFHVTRMINSARMWGHL